MNRVLFLVGIIMLIASAGCGGGGGGEDDLPLDALDVEGVDQGGPESVAAFCEQNPGSECDDDNPCTKGKGLCYLTDAGAVCQYEDSAFYKCEEPPDDCSSSGQCDGNGGCTWELSDGWCKIDGACVADGADKPGNPCQACVPDVDRGGWSPVSGAACVPADNPCTDSGKCQEGFCVAVAAGAECATDFDCIDKDNGNLCDGLLKCDDCACMFDPESVVVCDTLLDTECEKTECIPDIGECVTSVLLDGSACDDDDPCTGNDVCGAGACAGTVQGEPVWTAAPSPATAYLTSVEVVPGIAGTIFAAGSGGVVYRSDDLGQTFQQSDILASGGVPGEWLQVTDATPTGVLVIFDGVLFVSIDGGLSYSQKLTGCEALAKAAAAAGTFVAICQHQVYESLDNGVTWATFGSIPIGGGVEVVALAAQNGATLFLGTKGEDAQGRGHVYRSQDTGASWTMAEPPDRPADAHVSVNGLLLSAKAPDKMFLGFTNIKSEVLPFGAIPLYRTDDLGGTWVPLNTNVQGQSFVPLALDAIGRLWVGVDSALSRGGNYGNGPWGPIPQAPETVPILRHAITDGAVYPNNDFSFLVPAANGLAVAMNLGAEWKLYNGGLNGGVFANLAACAGSSTMYSQELLSNALFRSADGGATWAALKVPAQGLGRRIAKLACSDVDDKVVYAFFGDGGLMVTLDGGQTFQVQNEQSGIVLASINALSASPGTPNRIVASRLGMGAIVSEDGAFAQGSGFTTLPVPDSYLSDVLVDVFDSTVIYAGTMGTDETGSARIHVCTGAGASCSMRLQAPGGTAAAKGSAFTFAPDLSVPGRVFAALSGSEATLYYTNDYGNSWQVMTDLPMLGVSDGGGILPDAEVKGSFFVAFRLASLMRYDNVGHKWSILDGSPVGISSLVYHPSEPGKLLAGSALEAKVFASADGGATWTLMKDFNAPGYAVHRLVAEEGQLMAILFGRAKDEGLLYRFQAGQWSKSTVEVPVNDVAVQPGEPFRILAAGRLGGLYASDDAGATFQQFGALDSAALDLLVSKGDSQTIYAAVRCGTLPDWYDPGQTFGGAECGVRRSSDGGQNWFTTLNTSGSPCTSLAQAEENSLVLVAACAGPGTYLTDDGATSWTNLGNMGLGGGVDERLKNGMFVAISKGTLLLGTHARSMLRAQFDMNNWALGDFDFDFAEGAETLLPVAQVSVVVDPFDSARLLVYSLPGGLARTDLFGSEWRNASPPVGPEPEAVEDGISAAAIVPGFVEDPAGADLWVAEAGRGLFRSKDGGANYIFGSKDSAAVSEAHPLEIVSHPDYQGKIWYAAVEDVFRSQDGGATWTALSAGLGSGAIEALLGPFNGQVYVSVDGAGLFMMPFDSASWQKAHAADVSGDTSAAWPGRHLSSWYSTLVGQSSKSDVRVGVDPFGLYDTVDGGLSFNRGGLGLPVGRVLGLTRSPHDGEFVLAGTPDGIYASVDGGKSFLPVSEGTADVGLCFSFAFDAADPATVYALCADKLPHGLPASGKEPASAIPRKLWVTKDGGATWSTAGFGLAGEGAALDILGDPSASGVAYCATGTSGVLRSEDGGATFAQWSTGLPAPTTGGAGALFSKPLALSLDGKSYLLGTDGFGFYSRVTSGACE